jgi:hypothetical protein
MRDLGVADKVDQYELTDVLARSGMAPLFKAIEAKTGATRRSGQASDFTAMIGHERARC